MPTNAEAVADETDAAIRGDRPVVLSVGIDQHEYDLYC